MQLLLALAETLAVVTPTVTAVTVTSANGGSCPSDAQGTVNSASLAVRWTIANPDTVSYVVKLYKDGILVASGVIDYDETVDGSVEYGPISQYTVGWVYRVDVVRVSDNVVVSTRSAAPWTMTYGGCPNLG